MVCPKPSVREVEALISQVNTLLANVTDTQVCDTECQEERILDNLKTNLEESTDNYTSCEAQFKGDERAYIIQKYGISYYNQQEANKKKDLLATQNETLIGSFMKKMAETNNNFGVLQNDTNHLKLIQNMYNNTGVNKSLNDIFGVTISPFENEGFRTLETINQEITFSFKKNETGKFINMVLYIIYYVLAVFAIIYMIFNNIEKKIIIPVSIFILVLPLLSIIKFMIYLFSILRTLV